MGRTFCSGLTISGVREISSYGRVVKTSSSAGRSAGVQLPGQLTEPLEVTLQLPPEAPHHPVHGRLFRVRAPERADEAPQDQGDDGGHKRCTEEYTGAEQQRKRGANESDDK